jgi:hypothetical protein
MAGPSDGAGGTGFGDAAASGVPEPTKPKVYLSDVVLVVDATRSMEPVFEALKAELVDALRSDYFRNIALTKNRLVSLDMRVRGLMFRDRTVQKGRESLAWTPWYAIDLPHEMQQRTAEEVRAHIEKSLQGLIAWVGGLKALSGGDAPESLADALLAAALMDYRENANILIFAVSDSVAKETLSPETIRDVGEFLSPEEAADFEKNFHDEPASRVIEAQLGFASEKRGRKTLFCVVSPERKEERVRVRQADGSWKEETRSYADAVLGPLEEQGLIQWDKTDIAGLGATPEESARRVGELIRAKLGAVFQTLVRSQTRRTAPPTPPAPLLP